MHVKRSMYVPDYVAQFATIKILKAHELYTRTKMHRWVMWNVKSRWNETECEQEREPMKMCSSQSIRFIVWNATNFQRYFRFRRFRRFRSPFCAFTRCKRYVGALASRKLQPNRQIKAEIVCINATSERNDEVKNVHFCTFSFLWTRCTDVVAIVAVVVIKPNRSLSDTLADSYS